MGSHKLMQLLFGNTMKHEAKAMNVLVLRFTSNRRILQIIFAGMLHPFLYTVVTVVSNLKGRRNILVILRSYSSLLMLLKHNNHDLH